jgi:hypothetical protein
VVNATSTASNLTAANNAIYNVTGIGYDGDTDRRRQWLRHHD